MNFFSYLCAKFCAEGNKAEQNTTIYEPESIHTFLQGQQSEMVSANNQLGSNANRLKIADCEFHEGHRLFVLLRARRVN